MFLGLLRVKRMHALKEKQCSHSRIVNLLQKEMITVMKGSSLKNQKKVICAQRVVGPIRTMAAGKCTGMHILLVVWPPIVERKQRRSSLCAYFAVVHVKMVGVNLADCVAVTVL